MAVIYIFLQHELSGYRHRVTELEEELKILKGDLHEKDGKISVSEASVSFW